MTVVAHNDIAYSGVVNDVIETLKDQDQFVLKIWVDSTEIPFTATDDDEVEFLHESIKITTEHRVRWILYGIIMVFEVVC